MMIQSRRDFVLSIATLLGFAPVSSTGLEARAHAAARTQEIAAPGLVRTPKEFFDYVKKETQRLNGNRDKTMKGNNVPYDKSEYEKLIGKIIQYYAVPISSSEVVKSENFFISAYFSDLGLIFAQCKEVNGPEVIGPNGERISDIRINGIRLFRDRVVLEGGRQNGKYSLPIKPIPYYAKPP